MKNKKGFTLVEILVVLVVAGILLALILPNALKAITRASVTEHESNIDNIQTALFMCFTERRDWTLCDAPNELEGAANNFIQAYPAATPFGGTYNLGIDPNNPPAIRVCSVGATAPQGMTAAQINHCSNN